MFLLQTFSTPRYHPKSQPFVDHVFTFTIADNRIWFRNYQVMFHYVVKIAFLGFFFFIALRIKRFLLLRVHYSEIFFLFACVLKFFSVPCSDHRGGCLSRGDRPSLCSKPHQDLSGELWGAYTL